MDETIPVPSLTKTVPLDHRTSQPSSPSSNNLLKPDNNPWNTNNNDVDLSRMKSQSISNIAGKLIKI